MSMSARGNLARIILSRLGAFARAYSSRLPRGSSSAVIQWQYPHTLTCLPHSRQLSLPASLIAVQAGKLGRWQSRHRHRRPAGGTAEPSMLPSGEHTTWKRPSFCSRIFITRRAWLIASRVSSSSPPAPPGPSAPPAPGTPLALQSPYTARRTRARRVGAPPALGGCRPLKWYTWKISSSPPSLLSDAAGGGGDVDMDEDMRLAMRLQMEEQAAAFGGMGDSSDEDEAPAKRRRGGKARGRAR
mmetsp:Transcript_1818/g.5711  ORF Transcript_1818/g.5711 Transcript_1818/m.5711 type:complete len:243 (-) Transcript_1818:326-1054(-)